MRKEGVLSAYCEPGCGVETLAGRADDRGRPSATESCHRRADKERSGGVMGMKTTSAYLAVLAIVASLPVNAAAQTVARSFADLQLRVKTGDTVYVFDGSRRETRGRIDLLSPASLRLAFNGNRREFLEADVTRIERRGRDSIRNGLLIGLGAGAVVGFLSGRSVDEGPCPPKKGCGEAELLGTVGGAFWGGAAGWITDALIRKRDVIYLAPGKP